MPVIAAHGTAGTLTFHGEGQTFSISPLLAPGRIQAFEATNLRAFCRAPERSLRRIEQEREGVRQKLDVVKRLLVNAVA